MRPADTVELLKTLAVDVREFVAQTVEPLSAKHAELEARVASIPVEKGAPGADGASAFDLACTAGFTGSESEWLESLRGPAGESVKGDPGEAGQSVTLDDIRALIEQAVANSAPLREAEKQLHSFASAVVAKFASADHAG